ncbi:MAG: hypothetical protein AAB611_02045, partial [Patescibacteria group bacterium]
MAIPVEISSDPFQVIDTVQNTATAANTSVIAAQTPINTLSNVTSAVELTFDNLLKKITERLKKAITEAIKKQMLKLLQGSGAPQWVTNWLADYINKFDSVFQQESTKALAQVEKNYQSNQSFTTVRSLMNASFKDPTILAPGLEKIFALMGAGAKAREAADTKRLENVANNGMKSKTSQNCPPNATTQTISGSPGETQGGGAFAFSNEELLTPYELTRVAQSDVLNLRPQPQINFNLPSSINLSVPQATLDTLNLGGGPNITNELGGLKPGSVDLGTQGQATGAQNSNSGCTESVTTPGITFDKVLGELFGIDIKQMLSNTIEGWVDSFLNENLMNKLGGGGGKSGSGGGSGGGGG